MVRGWGILGGGVCRWGMRSQSEIEAELRDKKKLLGNSDEMDRRVRPYINALEWILSGPADQVGAVRVSEWGRFEKAMLAARTQDGKIFVSEEVPNEGVYSLLRYSRPSDN